MNSLDVLFNLCVNFKDCLNVFGVPGNTTLKMIYAGQAEPLKLMLEKDGIVVKSMIKTQNPGTVSFIIIF